MVAPWWSSRVPAGVEAAAGGATIGRPPLDPPVVLAPMMIAGGRSAGRRAPPGDEPHLTGREARWERCRRGMAASGVTLPPAGVVTAFPPAAPRRCPVPLQTAERPPGTKFVPRDRLRACPSCALAVRAMSASVRLRTPLSHAFSATVRMPR